MVGFHANLDFVESTACLYTRRGMLANLARLFPVAAATAAETSFSAAQRGLKKRSESEI
jgi:hypothetical protein